MTREELKQADTKKLISALQYCGRDSYYATYYDEVVDEITQRLKRIEELEGQVTRAFEVLEGKRKKIEELEKENETLKKQLEALSGDIPWSELKDVSEVTEELTEAKDLLSRWIDDRPYTVSEQKDLIADTEQFLEKVK